MLVQPSGLIFLVIIAIWAAYLLQHWVRRREHLATARSVDRFSDAMRVLERRRPLPESDLSMPQPRSYSVSPARPSRSEVVVKRAQTSPPIAPSRPPAARRSVAPSSATAPSVERHSAATSSVAGPSARGVQGGVSMSARRVRGLSLLASLSLLVVVSPLAALSVLPWWSVLVAVGVLLVDLAWLRHAAATQRSASRPNARVGPDSVRDRGSKAPARTAAARTTGAAVGATAGVVAGPADRVERTVAGPAVAPGTEEHSQLAVGSDPGVDLLGWAPVPVPPPTYTLKAKAPRPVPAPAAVAEPTPTPASSFDGLINEGELDGLLDRRHAAGA